MSDWGAIQNRIQEFKSTAIYQESRTNYDLIIEALQKVKRQGSYDESRLGDLPRIITRLALVFKFIDELTSLDIGELIKEAPVDDHEHGATLNGEIKLYKLAENSYLANTIIKNADETKRAFQDIFKLLEGINTTLVDFVDQEILGMLPEKARNAITNSFDDAMVLKLALRGQFREASELLEMQQK